MAHLVDSSIFIALERRGDAPAALTALLPSETLAIASITASELLTGVHRADTPSRRARRGAFVESILAAFPIFSVDLPVARTHARLWAQLAAAGQLIGDRDMLIAATALTHRYDILTNNIRDFTRIPGLTVHQPTWPGP